MRRPAIGKEDGRSALWLQFVFLRFLTRPPLYDAPSPSQQPSFLSSSVRFIGSWQRMNWWIIATNWSGLWTTSLLLPLHPFPCLPTSPSLCPVYEHERHASCCFMAGVVLCGLVRATFFVSHLKNPGLCVNTRFFFSTHTEQTASRPWGDICWISQKVYLIIMDDCTSKCWRLLHVIKKK